MTSHIVTVRPARAHVFFCMSSSSDPSLSRRERERRMRRHAMRDAARAVFAEKGYADATLDEIAERAEFGKGTIYNYFEDGKEGLLFAVFEDIYRELEELIRTVFREEREEQSSLREAFHTFATRYLEIIRDRQDLFLVLVKEGYRLGFSKDEKRVQFFQELHERLLEALVPVLEEAADRGEIQSLPPVAVANLFLSNIRNIGVHSILEKETCPCRPEEEQAFVEHPKEGADFLTTLLFDGLDVSPRDGWSSH